LLSSYRFSFPFSVHTAAHQLITPFALLKFTLFINFKFISYSFCLCFSEFHFYHSIIFAKIWLPHLFLLIFYRFLLFLFIVRQFLFLKL